MFSWLAAIWVYWIVGLGLGALGVAGVLWGWFGDRWRYGAKTPRCRRCRYDMSGAVGRDGNTIFTCPECGHIHKCKTSLHRPRRGWKRAAAGGLLIWASLYLLTSPAVRLRMNAYREPWYIAAIPDDIRLRTWSLWPKELRRTWTYSWVGYQEAQTFTSLSASQLALLADGLAIDIRDTDRIHRHEAAQVLALMTELPERCPEAVRVLASALDHPDIGMRYQALAAFCDVRNAAAYADRLLEVCWWETDADQRRILLFVLERISHPSPAVVEEVARLQAEQDALQRSKRKPQ